MKPNSTENRPSVRAKSTPKAPQRISAKTDEEAAENGFAGECEGDNGNDEETEDEDEAEGFGMTM